MQFANEETARAYAYTQHYKIAGEVIAETEKQLEKWKVQDHPLGFSSTKQPLFPTEVNLDLRSGAELERIFRMTCEARFKEGVGTWKDILLEEVFEALATDDPEKSEEELIQVAAVAVSAVAASRRARQA